MSDPESRRSVAGQGSAGGRLLGVLKDTLIYTLGGAGRQFVGIILVPIYTRMFLPEEFGAIDLLTTGLAALTLLLQTGTDSALGRYFAASQDPGERREIASTVLFYLGAGSLAVLAVGVPSADWIAAELLRETRFSSAVLAAVWSLPFMVLYIHFKNVLKWSQRSRAVVTLGLSGLLFQTLLTILLVVGIRTGIVGIYLANLATGVVFSAAGLWLTREHHGPIVSLSRLASLLRFGFPLVFMGLAAYVLTYSDRYFLQYMRGLDEVGFYGLGYKIASFMGLAFMGFQSALGPFVYSTYMEPGTPRLLARLFDYAGVAYALAITAVSLFARELVLLFGTPEYIVAYTVVPLLATSMAIFTLGGYFSFGIGIAARTVHQGWASTLAAGLNIGLNFVLIPRYGIMGAAVATLVSYFVWGVVLMALSQRFYPVEYRFGRNLVNFMAMALIIALAYRYLMSEVSVLNILLKLLLLIAVATVPFIIGLVGRADVSALRSLIARRSLAEPAVAARSD